MWRKCTVRNRAAEADKGDARQFEQQRRSDISGAKSDTSGASLDDRTYCFRPRYAAKTAIRPGDHADNEEDLSDVGPVGPRDEGYTSSSGITLAGSLGTNLRAFAPELEARRGGSTAELICEWLDR